MSSPPITLPNLPAGWSRGNVSAPVVKRAREVLKMGYGYGRGLVDIIDGVAYAFRVEPHFDNHPSLRPGQSPTAPDAPAPYWHPGVSVWTRRDPSAPFPDGLDSAVPVEVGSGTVSPLVGLGLVALGMGVGYVASGLAAS